MIVPTDTLTRHDQVNTFRNARRQQSKARTAYSVYRTLLPPIKTTNHERHALQQIL